MRFSKLLLFLLLCPFALEAAPAITVSGNSVTILGAAQTISLTCTLIDPNNTGNLRSGSNIITTFITSTATPGNVATCGPIYGNDVITDGYGNANTTYYKVQVFTVSGSIVASTPSLQQFYAFTGSGTIDLATATPLAPSFFTGPTGNVVMPGTLTVTGAATFNGGGTHSGTETFANINKVVYVDGVTNTTVQAAINALSASGGTVSIPPGTYVGPTSIPNSNTALICQSWLGCTFSYTTSQTFGFTGSALANLKIDGIIFDFGGNNAGLTLQNLQYAKIAMQVQNTGSASALTLISPNGSVPGLNLWNNDFSFLNIQNANTGITLNGDANINTCTSAQNASGAVFNNRFGYIYMSGIANIGLNFTSGVDSNNFDHVFIDLASSNLNGTGIVLASRCVTAGGGVGLTHFAHVTLEANGSPYTGHLFIANGNSEAIFGYLGLSNVSTPNAMQFSATAHVMGNVELNNPFGLTTPTHFFTTAETAVAGPLATAGANVYAPTYNWISNEWNGSASAPSTWSFQPSGNASGISTFDSMILSNTGTSNSNGFLGLGLQIPNRLIVATQAGHLGIFTHANTADRTYTFPDASGPVPITPNLLISATAPTIAAGGCGGGAASIVVSNGTAAFKVNVGTTPGSACTITMPSATTGWNCFATDITTNSTSVFLQKQTGAESQTSVVITNFNDVAVATAFVGSDILKVSCHAD